MTYAESTLLDNEKIIYSARPSVVIFSQPVILFVCGVFFATLGGAYSILGIIFLIVAALQTLVTSVGYFCSEYVITNKRILMKVGFIGRKSLEIFLHRIEGIYVSQSVLGRIFNFGAVVISGIGGSKDPFYYVPYPEKFRKAAQEQMETASKII